MKNGETETATEAVNTKEVLTSDEVARYMGISKSYLYKLTMARKIPHSKPLGKKCFFSRDEIVKWLQSNPVATDTELTKRAQNMCSNNRGITR